MQNTPQMEFFWGGTLPYITRIYGLNMVISTCFSFKIWRILGTFFQNKSFVQDTIVFLLVTNMVKFHHQKSLNLDRKTKQT